jgi:DNA mismatch repair protein MutL
MSAWNIGGQTEAMTPGWSGSLDAQAFRGEGGEAETEAPQLGLDWSRRETAVSHPPADAAPQPLAGERLPIMRVVGQVGAAYIITEGPDGMYLIDQHAAHERILYEQFMAQREKKEETLSQGLVTGTAVHLSPPQATLLEEHQETLSETGFQIDPFGPNAFMIRAVPAILADQDPASALLAVIEELEGGKQPLQQKIEEKIILRVCKTAAVKAGQTLSRQEMEAMVQQLEECDSPHTCPHGRPTLIHLSVAQLAKQFGRI